MRKEISDFVENALRVV